MHKLLMAAAVLVAAAAGTAQAVEISVTNPSLPTQPPPVLSPATPALSSAFTQQPFPLVKPAAAPRAPAQSTASPPGAPAAGGSKPATQR
jgi:hypothetical protein